MSHNKHLIGVYLSWRRAFRFPVTKLRVQLLPRHEIQIGTFAIRHRQVHQRRRQRGRRAGE